MSSLNWKYHPQKNHKKCIFDKALYTCITYHKNLPLSIFIAPSTIFSDLKTSTSLLPSSDSGSSGTSEKVSGITNRTYVKKDSASNVENIKIRTSAKNFYSYSSYI